MSVCAVKLPDPQNSAIGHDGEEAAAWEHAAHSENRLNLVAAIIDVSLRGIGAELVRSILG